LKDLLKSTWKLLWVIFAVSVVARLMAALVMGNSVSILPGTYDQVSYHNLALRLLGGYGFTFDRFWWPATAAGEQTAHWSYLYTFYLALVYAIFGPQPILARLIQAVLVGILHPFLVYLIGERLFSKTVGLVSAGIAAVYAYFIYYHATLMTEPFYITAILGSLYFAIRLAKPDPDEPRRFFREPWLWVYLSLCLGAAILLRQLFMLVLPFLLLWIVYARRRNQHPFPWRGLAMVLAIQAAMILPFTFFNLARFDRFVLLNTNAGFAFFWGNHPIHGTNFYAILPPDKPSYQELIPREYRRLDEAALDQQLLAEGLGFVRQDPGRYLLLSLSRVKDYFVFWPTPDSHILSNLSRLGSFTLFLPFMLYGIWLAWAKRPRPLADFLASPQALLLAFVLVYTVIHLLTWTLIRYRLPVDAVLLIFAGLGIVHLAERYLHARETKKSLPSKDRQGFFVS
jgi:hypothetical protein